MTVDITRSTAVMQDPSTPFRKRVGIYLFFLADMAGFGTLTFYLTYHQQQGESYMVGAMLVIIYVLFYLMLFGADDVLWLFINGLLGALMVRSWLETLATPFIPPPSMLGHGIITDFDGFPVVRHILPGAVFLMYQFMLRNFLIDALGARFNPRRKRYVGWLFVVVSVVQILLP